MRQIEMSAKELLILAAHLGAENLLGVRDPFESLERADLTAEIPQILIDAEKKGLVELNFEGTFSVAPETAILLKPCAFCTKYISVEYSRNGQLQEGRNLYVGERLVLLEQSGDHVLIRETKPEQAVEDLLSGSGVRCRRMPPWRRDNLFCRWLSSAYCGSYRRKRPWSI